MFLGVPLKNVGISPGNGMASNRQQDITWTNVDTVYWGLYAALGGDELKIIIQNISSHDSLVSVFHPPPP